MKTRTTITIVLVLVFLGYSQNAEADSATKSDDFEAYLDRAIAKSIVQIQAGKLDIDKFLELATAMPLKQVWSQKTAEDGMDARPLDIILDEALATEKLRAEKSKKAAEAKREKRKAKRKKVKCESHVATVSGVQIKDSWLDIQYQAAKNVLSDYAANDGPYLSTKKFDWLLDIFGQSVLTGDIKQRFATLKKCKSDSTKLTSIRYRLLMATTEKPFNRLLADYATAVEETCACDDESPDVQKEPLISQAEPIRLGLFEIVVFGYRNDYTCESAPADITLDPEINQFLRDYDHYAGDTCQMETETSETANNTAGDDGPAKATTPFVYNEKEALSVLRSANRYCIIPTVPSIKRSEMAKTGKRSYWLRA